MSQSNQLVEALGVDPARIGEFQQAVIHNAFFAKLADHQIFPRNDDEAVQLCQMADMLAAHEQKVASHQSSSRIGNAWNIMAGIGQKHASAPAIQAQLFQADVADKLGGILSDPQAFAYALGIRAMQQQPQATAQSA